MPTDPNEDPCGDISTPRLPDGAIDWMNGHTSLGNLAKEGWRIIGNGHGIWFERRDDWSVARTGPREMQHIPYWVHQMIGQAEKNAVKNLQAQLRGLLGIKSRRSEFM